VHELGQSWSSIKLGLNPTPHSFLCYLSSSKITPKQERYDQLPRSSEKGNDCLSFLSDLMLAYVPVTQHSASRMRNGTGRHVWKNSLIGSLEIDNKYAAWSDNEPNAGQSVGCEDSKYSLPHGAVKHAARATM
jgi:hypothetical protein